MIPPTGGTRIRARSGEIQTTMLCENVVFLVRDRFFHEALCARHDTGAFRLLAVINEMITIHLMMTGDIKSYRSQECIDGASFRTEDRQQHLHNRLEAVNKPRAHWGSEP
jgi:hypothetical protein